MCLEKKSRIPRIATKDIIVYKILISKNNKLYTPFCRNEIEIGKTYKGIFDKYNIFIKHRLRTFTNSIICFLISLFFSKFIHSGYIHFYSNYDNIPNSVKHYYVNSYRIIKCIIPKGTLYFIGKNGDIASRKIKYIKIID